jgi:hypothetical protein
MGGVGEAVELEIDEKSKFRFFQPREGLQGYRLYWDGLGGEAKVGANFQNFRPLFQDQC